MIKVRQSIVIKILLIILAFQLIFMPVSNANVWDDIFKQGDDFLSEGKNQQSDVLRDQNGNIVLDENGKRIPVTVTDKDSMKKFTNMVYNVLFGLGVVLSVVVGAVLGIKLMWGSIEQQAKVKEMLIPYVLGCVIVFGAFGIWKMIINIVGYI